VFRIGQCNLKIRDRRYTRSYWTICNEYYFNKTLFWEVFQKITTKATLYVNEQLANIIIVIKRNFRRFSRKIPTSCWCYPWQFSVAHGCKLKNIHICVFCRFLSIYLVNSQSLLWHVSIKCQPILNLALGSRMWQGRCQ